MDIGQVDISAQTCRLTNLPFATLENQVHVLSALIACLHTGCEDGPELLYLAGRQVDRDFAGRLCIRAARFVYFAIESLLTHASSINKLHSRRRKVASKYPNG